MHVTSPDGDPGDLCFRSAVGLAAGYRDGTISPRAVVDAHLDRIAALDGAIGAYVAVHAIAARAAAEAAERRFRDGSPLGPLDGIPVAVKDLVAVAGTACMAGSPSMRGRISEQDAAVIGRLRGQGAVLLGKVHTVEFALGGWGTNAHLGSPCNPWSAGVPYTAGGSSSGSAAAVAARMATLAIGTDTGGSVRVPAGFNGLVGLKTTRGRISLQGVTPLSPTLDTVGPIARTVADAALMYRAMQVADIGSPVGRPAPDRDRGEPDEGIAGFTLAAIGEADRTGIDPEILSAYDAALATFAGLGARIGPIALPRPLTAYGERSEIMLAEAYALYGALAEDTTVQMDPGVRRRILSGAIDARSYIAARWRAEADAREMLQVFGDVDALLVPTARTLPIPLAAVDEETTPAMLTRFVNQIDFCALAIPSGLSARGLPISLQIVCRPREEARALRIGQAFEAATSFVSAVPPMARAK